LESRQEGIERQHSERGRKEKCQMALILWIIAVVLVIAGIITLISGSVIFGIVLIVLGLLVGPGGVSIFSRGNRV